MGVFPLTVECHIDTLPHLICPRHGSPGGRGRWAVASTWSLSTTATFPPPFMPLPGAVRPPGATKLQWKADPGVPIQGLPTPPQVPSASPPKPHYHFWYPFSSLIQKWRERSWAPGLDQTLAPPDHQRVVCQNTNLAFLPDSSQVKDWRYLRRLSEQRGSLVNLSERLKVNLCSS